MLNVSCLFVYSMPLANEIFIVNLCFQGIYGKLNHFTSLFIYQLAVKLCQRAFIKFQYLGVHLLFLFCLVAVESLQVYKIQ